MVKTEPQLQTGEVQGLWPQKPPETVWCGNSGHIEDPDMSDFTMPLKIQQEKTKEPAGEGTAANGTVPLGTWTRTRLLPLAGPRM